MTTHQVGFPQCTECFLHHNPENDECGFYEDYCNERYIIESENGNYYIVELADGSKIYVFRDEFACSHGWNTKEEFGDACEKCTKHFWNHIEPIDQSLWLMYYSMKINQEKEYH